MLVAYCLFFILIALLCFGIKKAPPAFGIFAFSLLAIWMSAYWAIYGNTLNFSSFWFTFAKFYTILISAIFAQWLKTKDFKPIYGKIIYGALLINILEACIADMTKFSVLNGIAGILLIISQPLPETAKIDSKTKDILYPTSWFWIIGYTLWNFTFLYGQQLINVVPLGLLHLGIPLLMSISKPASYLENRTYALAFTIFLWVFPPSRAYLDWSGSFFQPQVWNILCCSSFIFASLLALSTLKNRYFT